MIYYLYIYQIQPFVCVFLIKNNNFKKTLHTHTPKTKKTTGSRYRESRESPPKDSLERGFQGSSTPIFDAYVTLPGVSYTGNPEPPQHNGANPRFVWENKTWAMFFCMKFFATFFWMGGLGNFPECGEKSTGKFIPTCPKHSGLGISSSNLPRFVVFNIFLSFKGGEWCVSWWVFQRNS